MKATLLPAATLMMNSFMTARIGDEKVESPNGQGSEPFWSLRLNRNEAVFRGGASGGAFHVSPWIVAEGSGNYFSFVVWMTNKVREAT